MKKTISIVLAALMLIVCLPVGAVTVNEADPVGNNISAVNAPYLMAGGESSTTDFLTAQDFASHTVTIINVWSDGCGPCVQEMPYFQRVHEEYGPLGVLVVGCCSLWIQGSYSGEWNYLQNQGYTYMNVIQDTVLYNLYSQNNFVPQTFIVDQHGIVVDFIGGGTDYATLVQKINQWAAAPEGTHLVKFLDWDGTVLKQQYVFEGEAAVPPEAPSCPGFEFIGWDKDFSCVMTDLEVYAQYRALPLGDMVWAPTDTIEPGEEYLIGFVSEGKTYLAVNCNVSETGTAQYYANVSSNYYGYTATAAMVDDYGVGCAGSVNSLTYCKWRFTASGSGYTIRSVYQSGRYLNTYTSTSYPDLYPGTSSNQVWYWNNGKLYRTLSGANRYAQFISVGGEKYMGVDNSVPSGQYVQLFRQVPYTAPQGEAGDVDCNSIVDMSDVSLLFSYLNGGGSGITEQGMLNADVNADGSVSVMDITGIFGIIANS